VVFQLCSSQAGCPCGFLDSWARQALGALEPHMREVLPEWLEHTQCGKQPVAALESVFTQLGQKA
jgi:hypothetical protein